MSEVLLYKTVNKEIRRDVLKDPNQPFGKDYFKEQLERIRDIRSSERRFYQKITDIYAQCSADYNSHSNTNIKTFRNGDLNAK